MLDAGGPDGGSLSIDTAWLGAEHASRLLFVQSGVHGVEAFVGAAVQLDLLARPPVLDRDTALVMVHVLNPYGMAWLRRVNEHNVDLNRNCLDPGDDYRGAPPGYRLLHGLINPPRAPGFDFFALRAASRVIRHGWRPLKQAIAAGQYDFPQGLFYGGAHLEQGPALLRTWLRQLETRATEVLVLDLHSGLGRYGEASVFMEYCGDPDTEHRLRLRFGDVLTAPGSSGPGYRIRGGVGNIYRQAFPAVASTYLTVEFGTYSILRVLRALREENRWHFHGSGGMKHPAKSALREALGPADPGWRRRVLQQGGRLVGLVLSD